MASLNKVCLLGNLGADPDVKTTQDGSRVANLRLATSESWKDKRSGERKERTEWHRVTVWNDGLVGVIEKYLRKGSTIYVEGKLQTRKWTDKDGSDRYTTEVVLTAFDSKLLMVGGKKADGDSGERTAAEAQHTGGYRGADLDDEIPF